MLVDFGILSAIRQVICDNGIGLERGLKKSNIYIMIPEILPQPWPAVFLELEETWCPSRKIKKAPQARVAFKISVLCNNNDGSAAIEISNQICSALDGLSLLLDEGNIGMLKFKSSIVDFKKVLQIPRKVEQFYDSIIRTAEGIVNRDRN
ncbi:MAG: hypothetical protein LBS83_01580 [Holosporales bacterium]|nr:hypothetical protein [Holosporales bacterium]